MSGAPHSGHWHNVSMTMLYAAMVLLNVACAIRSAYLGDVAWTVLSCIAALFLLAGVVAHLCGRKTRDDKETP